MLKFFGNRVRFVLWSALILYSGLIVSWFLLWVTSGDGLWWMMIINRVAPRLFLPIPLFFIFILPLRSKMAHLILSIPALIFVFLYFPYFIPKFPAETQAETAVSVMSFNLLYDNFAYEEVATLILSHQPDLIALQEVQPGMMAALQRRLKPTYPYSVMGTPNPYGTTAVFSRHPLERHIIVDLGIDRPATLIQTKISGHSVTFASAHFQAYGFHKMAPEEFATLIPIRTVEQNHEAKTLLTYLLDQDGMIILGCDCNSTEMNSSYRIVADGLQNAARTSGWAFTNHLSTGTQIDRRLEHIDYIFYRGTAKPNGVVLPESTAGSDHFPIIATFDFPDQN